MMTSATGSAAGATDGGHGSDGLALGAGAALSALAGVLGWLIVARLVPQAEFGAASAFVAGFLLVSGVTELNLGIALLKWLPPAGRRSAALIRRCTLVLLAASVAGALVYLVLPGSAVVVGAAGAGTPLAAAVLLFVASTAAWSVLHLQDFSFVGLGRPWWAVGKNLLLLLARVAALLTVGATGAPGAVVWAWAGATIGCAVVSTAAAAWLGRRPPPSLDHPGRLPGRGEVAGFLGPTYVGTLAVTVLYNQIPLAVIVRVGTVDGGAFFLAWQAITVIDVVATYFASSLVGAVAREPARAAELVASTRRRLLLLFAPALAAGALLAAPVLAVFGPGFAVAVPAMRLLMVGMVLRLVVVHALATRQALGDARGFALLSVLSTGLVLLAVLVVPTDGTGPLGDDPLLAVAVAYVAVQVLSVAVLPLFGRTGPTAGPDGALPPPVDTRPTDTEEKT